MSAEKKAEDFEKQAEQKLKKGFFSFMTSQSTRNEAAADLYKNAAAQYKKAKNFSRAARAHEKQAELLDEIKCIGDAGNAYKEAAVMFKKAGETKESIKNYELVISIFQDSDRNSQAAKLYQEIAALEQEMDNTAGAIEAWEKAASTFDMVDQPSNRNKCLEKVAVLAGDDDQLDKCASIYEDLSDENATPGATNWNAPTYIWKAMLCRMVLEARKTGDVKESKDRFERHVDMTPKFASTREKKLLDVVFQAFVEMKEDDITQAVYNYDRITRLDSFCTKMLLELKRVLRDGTKGGKTQDGSGSDSEDFA